MLHSIGWKKVRHDSATEQWQHPPSTVWIGPPFLITADTEEWLFQRKGYKLDGTARTSAPQTRWWHSRVGWIQILYLGDSTFKELDIQSLPTLHQLQCHDSVQVTSLLQGFCAFAWLLLTRVYSHGSQSNF